MEGIYEKKDRKKQNNLQSSEEIGAAKVSWDSSA